MKREKFAVAWAVRAALVLAASKGTKMACC